MSNVPTASSRFLVQKKPYFLLREKKSTYQDQYVQSIQDKSLDMSKARLSGISSIKHSTKPSEAKLKNVPQENKELINNIEKNLEEKFYSRMIEDSASKSPSKNSTEKRPPSRLISEADVNQSRNLNITTSLHSNITSIVSPKTNVNFNTRTLVSEQDFMNSLSPRYQFNTIYSYNYLSKKSPGRENPEKSFAKSARSGNISGTSTYRKGGGTTRPGVFDRLYEDKSIVTHRYQEGELIGVKDILTKAQETLKRPLGTPSFDGVNQIGGEGSQRGERKFSFQQYLQNNGIEMVQDLQVTNDKDAHGNKYTGVRSVTPQVTSSQNVNPSESGQFNFFFGDTTNFGKHSASKVTHEKKKTADFNRNPNGREFPPDPAEIVYSSPKKEDENKQKAPKYFQNRSNQKENPNFKYSTSKIDPHKYQPILKR